MEGNKGKLEVNESECSFSPKRKLGEEGSKSFSTSESPLKETGDGFKQVRLSKEPESAIGEEFLRVCRACLKVVRVEDAFPLFTRGSTTKTELSRRLKSILQIDLFEVENPSLCTNCVNFINGVHNFRVNFLANENTLKDFEWGTKNRNLLHIVNRDKLKVINDEADWTPKGLGKEKGGTGRIKKKFNESELDDGILQEFDSDCSVTDGKDDSIDDEFSAIFNGNDDIDSEEEEKGFFVCEICRKLEESIIAYTNHMKKHSEDQFTCKECNLYFESFDVYLKHRRGVHGGFPKCFKCKRCPKRFNDKNELMEHKGSHRGTRALYRIKGKDYLVDSSGQKRMTCRYCLKDIHRNSLHRHIQKKHFAEDFLRTSKDKKFFRCVFCDRKYCRQKDFKRHLKTCALRGVVSEDEADGMEGGNDDEVPGGFGVVKDKN